ncbi:MAG: DUF6661 family protein [Bacillota bacterium]
MAIREGKLEFNFNLDKVIKFDECDFYTKKFKSLDGAKGVDFLGYNQKEFIMIEVKDFKGYEKENKNRIRVRFQDEINKVESLDIEVSKKVRETLACLLAAAMYNNETEIDIFYYELAKKANSGLKERPILKIILFLEGEFGIKNEDNLRILKTIKDSIKGQLRWLNAEVFVENINTQRKRHYFEAVRIE